MDSFSPSAPARVRTLILPIGRIRRSRFHTCLNLLAPHAEIKLGDVTPDTRPDRGVFSPLAFPDGHVLYDFTTSMVSNAELSLAPFELFREPLVVLGIVDAQEYDDTTSLEQLVTTTLTHMDEQHPRMLVRKLLLFGSNSGIRRGTLQSSSIAIPPADQIGSTTMRTVMCDITSNLLAEMTTLSASIKALPSIASPSIVGSGSASTPRNASATPILSRANSVGDESAVSTNANHQNRMSMPVLPSNSDPNGSRPQSPEYGRQTPPARTFDELVGGASSPPQSQKITPANSRDTSRDRVSMSGFGPGSLDERKRNQGKCRVAIVISSLHMMAGRWRDALQHLAEAATQARSFNDHIWHAKALETMLACLVLLAWAGIPFKIPSICYPIMERTSSKLAAITSPAFTTSNGVSSAEVAAARKELAIAIPEMANMIISIYNRAANYTGEFLPQRAYSECIIRLSKVQIGVIIGGNTLNDAAVSYIVKNTTTSGIRRSFVNAGKARITDMLMKAMPGPPELTGLVAADEASILAGIASALSVLGLERKKAMLLKDYVHVLIRALDDAKRAGAAEAGVHPSTNSISATSSLIGRMSGTSEGLQDFLSLLCQVYGVPEARWARSIGVETMRTDPTSDTNEASASLPEQLVGNLILRSFGSVNIKSDVLRTCISLCEALPDLHGVLHSSSMLLSIAGPGTAPNADTSDVLVTLSREEQILISGTIAKTTTDAKAVGLLDIEAEYWDEFLVRGVLLIDAPQTLSLHLHKKSDLLAIEEKQVAKKGPFIHNPFLEKPKSTTSHNLIVAGDEREFVVSLQNPYDFDVYIESIRFLAGEQTFGHATGLTLRPYRTQSFSVLGSLPDTGSYDFDKCLIKIRGCRERAFPIFAEAWRPPHDPKSKSIGLLKEALSVGRPESDGSFAFTTASAGTFPESTNISLTVIPAQPVLEMTSVSLPQSSIMLLEGERATFKIAIKNTSHTAIADFVHVSFTDSTTAAIEDVLTRKNLNSAELFEIEYQVKNQPAIKALGDKPKHINPNDTCELEFEVLGKPGLMSATILLDYASLDRSTAHNHSTFYTRQIAVPVSITVNASVQVHRFDILPVSRSANLATTEGLVDENDVCVLVLDMRNAWPMPLEIEFGSNGQQDTSSKQSVFLRSKEVVQPGHISRMVLLMPKVYIKNPHTRIRSANERQFVVSANGLSADVERTTRELFWYREALLQGLSATWKQVDSSKTGMVDLRSVLRLAPRMIDALKLDGVDIKMSVSDNPATASNDGFRVSVDEFAVLHTSIRNRSNVTIHALLRLRPSISHQSSDIALDLQKRLAWSGSLQSVLPPIAPGASVVVKLALCALCSGEYEIGATVEEVKPASPSDVIVEYTGEGQSIADSFTISGGRRTWMASKPCRIIAIEENEEVRE